MKAKLGEPIRLNIVNIGDQVHSFHLHAFTAYTVDHDADRPLPAQVLGLVPGEADRLVVVPTQPGLWLYHCHVVSHADGGMIGVMIVEA
jgi:FtsP/CotA-like multicopper oxidase with cupredoxin domain